MNVYYVLVWCDRSTEVWCYNHNDHIHTNAMMGHAHDRVEFETRLARIVSRLLPRHQFHSMSDRPAVRIVYFRINRTESTLTLLKTNITKVINRPLWVTRPRIFEDRKTQRTHFGIPETVFVVRNSYIHYGPPTTSQQSRFPKCQRAASLRNGARVYRHEHPQQFHRHSRSDALPIGRLLQIQQNPTATLQVPVQQYEPADWP